VHEHLVNLLDQLAQAALTKAGSGKTYDREIWVAAAETLTDETLISTIQHVAAFTGVDELAGTAS
jgi:hypothetical protein